MVARLSKMAFVVCLVAQIGFAEKEKPLRVKADEARRHIGKKVEVIFEVKHANNEVQRKTVYLDSEPDYKDPKNLGIAISEAGVADLKKKRKVDDVAAFYRGKTIRVVGTLVTEENRTYIKVNEAEQLDLAKEESKP